MNRTKVRRIKSQEYQNLIKEPKSYIACKEHGTLISSREGLLLTSRDLDCGGPSNGLKVKKHYRRGKKMVWDDVGFAEKFSKSRMYDVVADGPPRCKSFENG